MEIWMSKKINFWRDFIAMNVTMCVPWTRAKNVVALDLR